MRKYGRNRTGNNERVTFNKLIELCEQLIDILGCNCRPLSIKFGFFCSFNLYVNARHTFVNMDKITRNTCITAQSYKLIARKSRYKTQCTALMAKVSKHNGNVNALTARKHPFVRSTINTSKSHVVYANNVVKCWVKRNSCDHALTSTTFSKFWYSSAKLPAVRIVAVSNAPNSTRLRHPNLEASAKT